MNEVLETTKFVVQNSDLIKINPQKIKEFSDSFSAQESKHWLLEGPVDFLNSSDEEKLHFMLLFNALSFSYWGEPKWSVEYRDTLYDGAWAMVVSLRKAIEDGYPILDFNYCSQISKEEFRRVLLGNIEIPLFNNRLNIVHEVGQKILDLFDGKVMNLLKVGNNNASKLSKLIIDTFPSFKDVSLFKGNEIYFYKRAQLFLADIYQMFQGEGIGSITGIEDLTACADYKLPQILRKIGILEYSNELINKIDNKIELASGSAEEVEIRSNTIWAVEYIKEEVKNLGHNINSIEINDQLWIASQSKAQDDKPYHRTRTTSY